MTLRNLFWCAWFALTLVSSAKAFTVSFLGEPSSSLTASGITVPIYSEADLKVESTSYALHLTGAGLLKKKIGPLRVNVYLCSSYTDLIDGLSPNDPLKSLSQSKARMLQITLVRNVSADQLTSEFKKSLQINDVDPTQPAIKKLMDQLTDDLKAKQVFTLIGTHVGDQEKVEIAMPNKNMDSESPTLAEDLWKMWFGKPEDDGVAALKDQLVGKQWSLAMKPDELFPLIP